MSIKRGISIAKNCLKIKKKTSITINKKFKLTKINVKTIFINISVIKIFK